MTLDPQAKLVLDTLAAQDVPALETLWPEEARAMSIVPRPEVPVPVADIEDREIDGPEGELPLRIYWPEGEGPLPLLVFFHGGGFVLCDLDTHDGVCRAFCNGLAAVVVSVGYRLAPEAKYPAALEDCYAACCWAAANASDLNARADQLIVAGDSAGGNLATVVTLMARDRGTPAIAHQVLMYPVTDCSFDTPSYRENADGYFLTCAAMRWFWAHYLEDSSQGSEPYASPLRASLTGLPSASVITAEYDPLRDEGIAYVEALRRDGVSVEHRLFDGMIHGFASMEAGFEQTALAIDFLCHSTRAALGNRTPGQGRPDA